MLSIVVYLVEVSILYWAKESYYLTSKQLYDHISSATSNIEKEYL